jgi:hypothetical protein
VQAGAGTDTVVFSGNYAEYTFSQSDSYVSLMTNNTTNQVVSLHGVEQLQFDAGVANLLTTGSGEFLVNTYTTSSQEDPSITALNNGGFVVTWMSDGQDGDGQGIYAQMYDANGAMQGAEFRVNTYTINEQLNPSITALNNGGFVVAWQSYGQDGDGSGIYAQMYDANGDTQGNEFLVNTHTTISQDDPSITALNNGGFVVTWMSNVQDGDSYGIYAQMYDANGTTQGSEFQVNTYTTSYQFDSSITALNNGGFVVTWMSDGQDGDSWGVYAQMFDANGRVRYERKT